MYTIDVDGGSYVYIYIYICNHMYTCEHRFFEIMKSREKGTARYVAEADRVCFAVQRRWRKLFAQALVDFQA